MGDSCTAGWCAGFDWCGVTCTAAVLDGKWHPVVVHRLLDTEPRGFADLAAAAGDVSDRVLSDTLMDLREDGVVERTVVSEEPLRVEYALTATGRDLESVVRAMEEWGQRHG